MESSDSGLTREVLGQQFAADPASLGDVTLPEERLAPEIVDLVVRSTTVPHGLAFVRSAPIDCVAAALGVHPHVVDRTRDCMDRADLRKLVLREYARALSEPRPASPPPPAPPPARHAEDVVREAYDHALGVQFLLCAPLETAAITFGVHPDVVAEACALLAQRGVLPHRA